MPTDPTAGRIRRTKVIATLGPASTSEDALRELISAGVNVCRLNLSHGTLAEHTEVLARVRRVAESLDVSVAALADLCGPKIRLNRVAHEPLVLHPGDEVLFVRGDADCTPTTFTTNYEPLIDEVLAGHRIYIDDGLVKLLVTDKTAAGLVTVCTVGGEVRSRKGVNLPDSKLSVPALTDKDRVDLEWALEHDLDYVALSFVRQPDEVRELRRLINDRASGMRIIIKIEKAEAVARLDELAAESDGMMVARGDLGVELDIWRVPVVQEQVIQISRQHDIPVIVATQMLQSMVKSPMPTRAEVSDVANAINQKVDAIMLSAESAVGDFPVQTVQMMSRIAVSMEAFREPSYSPPRMFESRESAAAPTAAICYAAVEAAICMRAKAVVGWTATGTTVRMLSRHRLPMPVIGLTYDERVYRQIALLYGVIPVRVPPVHNPADMGRVLDSVLRSRAVAEIGDIVVVVTSTRPTRPGATDTALIHRVAAPS
jgi:pyruvate kinase